MSEFRKKPLVIEAVQWTGLNFREVASFVGNTYANNWTDNAVLIIETLEGDMTVSVHDWIIRGIKGEYYPCKPDVFAATYEPVAGSPTEATDDQSST